VCKHLSENKSLATEFFDYYDLNTTKQKKFESLIGKRDESFIEGIINLVLLQINDYQKKTLNETLESNNLTQFFIQKLASLKNKEERVEYFLSVFFTDVEYKSYGGSSFHTSRRNIVNTFSIEKIILELIENNFPLKTSKLNTQELKDNLLKELLKLFFSTNLKREDCWNILNTIKVVKPRKYVPLLISGYFKILKNNEKINTILKLLEEEKVIKNLIAYFNEKSEDNKSTSELDYLMIIFGKAERFDYDQFIANLGWFASEKENLQDDLIGNLLHEFCSTYEEKKKLIIASRLGENNVSIPLSYIMDMIKYLYKYSDLGVTDKALDYSLDIADGFFEYVKNSDVDIDNLLKELAFFTGKKNYSSFFAVQVLGYLGKKAKSKQYLLEDIIEDPGDFGLEYGKSQSLGAFQREIIDLAKTAIRKIDSTYNDRKQKELDEIPEEELEEIIGDASIWMNDPEDFREKALWNMFSDRSYEMHASYTTDDMQGFYEHYHEQAVQKINQYPIERVLPIILSKAKRGYEGYVMALKYLNYYNNSKLKQKVIEELLELLDKELIDEDFDFELMKTLLDFLGTKKLITKIIDRYKNKPLDFFSRIGYILPISIKDDLLTMNLEDEKAKKILKMISSSVGN